MFIIFQFIGKRIITKRLDNHGVILYNIIVIMTFYAQRAPAIIQEEERALV